MMRRIIRPYGIAACTGSLLVSAMHMRHSTARCDAATPAAERAAERAKELQAWRRGSTLDKLAREDPTAIGAERRVIAVVGITGAGKSTLANNLVGRSHKPFASSNSLKSVTDTVEYRDYEFFGSWRVLDTPGLQDTNKSTEDNLAELARFASFAPHGVSAFVVVVPRGRFTTEQMRAMQRLEHVFGPSFRRFAILVVTSAAEAGTLMHRSDVLDEINALPTGHYLREFVESLSLRVVSTENRFDPARQTSRMAMHQAVHDLLERNAGETYDISRFLKKELPHHEQAAAVLSARLGRCVHRVLVEEDTSGGAKLILRIECEVSLE